MHSSSATVSPPRDVLKKVKKAAHCHWPTWFRDLFNSCLPQLALAPEKRDHTASATQASFWLSIREQKLILRPAVLLWMFRGLPRISRAAGNHRYAQQLQEVSVGKKMHTSRLPGSLLLVVGTGKYVGHIHTSTHRQTHCEQNPRRT